MFRLCSRCVAYGSEWDVWKVERMQDLAKCSKLKCQRCVGSKMNPSAEQCILCTSVAKSQAHKPPKCHYWCPRLLSEIPNALINIKYCNSWKTNGWNLLAMLHLGIEISLNEAENSHAEKTHSFYICVIICHRSHFVRRHTVGSQVPSHSSWHEDAHLAQSSGHHRPLPPPTLQVGRAAEAGMLGCIALLM